MMDKPLPFSQFVKWPHTGQLFMSPVCSGGCMRQGCGFQIDFLLVCEDRFDVFIGYGILT
jgi:hypothetical protein